MQKATTRKLGKHGSRKGPCWEEGGSRESGSEIKEGNRDVYEQNILHTCIKLLHNK